MVQRIPSGGMRTFLIIWVGQLVSLIGSGLTAFALGVWIYEQSHSVTLLAINTIAFMLPQIVFAPIGGALVDRWDRRVAMMVSDTGAGLSTLVVAVLYVMGWLQPWHVFIATFFNSVFNSLQWPAWSAATTLLVPREHLGRASGMTQLAEAVGQLASPAIAGVLFVTIRLSGIILLDFATYLFAVLTMLLFVRIPRPEVSTASSTGKGKLWEEVRFGWTYITARAGLVGLLMYFATINFLGGTLGPLVQSMVLDTWSPEVMGYLGSIMGVGMLVGTLVMSTWGGPKRRVYGLLGAGVISGLFLMLIALPPSIPLLAVSGFGMMFTMPIMNGCSQAIWQSKVAPDIQGRVFSVRRAIAWSTSAVSPLLAAPLADYVFKPLLVEDGALVPLLGSITGVGPGRGVGLLVAVMGVLTAVVSIVALVFPRLRRVELELPDVVADGKPVAEPAASG